MSKEANPFALCSDNNCSASGGKNSLKEDVGPLSRFNLGSSNVCVI